MFRFFLLSLFVVPAAFAQTGLPQPGAIKSGTHPRLMVTEADIAKVKKAIESDPVARKWNELLQAKAKKALEAPLPEYKLVGPRLLDTSRKVKEQVLLLAGMYRLDGDKAKADRAVKEMVAAAEFPDWNPSHFLDVAEMTFAFAIGYDWLHAHLSPAERATIRKAIVEKGLKPGLLAYSAKNGKGEFWTYATHNWAQVCGGGLLVGSLAVADTDPQLAKEIYARAVPTLLRPTQRFAPDGGWDEGPGYWAYATEYVCYAWAATQTALKSDLGMKNIKGLGEAGHFWIQLIGPTGKAFNFADVGEGRAPGVPQMLWFAREFHRPAYGEFERNRSANSPGILHLLWCQEPEKPSGKALPLDAIFRGVDVACFHGSRDDPQATFVAFKGGDNKANHAHLDLGTFVLDSLGERWAVDLGSDNYNLPGYFGKERWTYYRLKTEGQNTLTLAGANQDESASAKMIAFHSSAERSFAVADLSSGYRTKPGSILRGVGLYQRQIVVVQDEFQTPTPAAWTWNMHTRATVTLAEGKATLKQGKASLEMRVLEPKGANFSVAPATQSSPQNENKGVSRLTLSTGKGKSQRIVVGFFPNPEAGDPAIEPLAKWISAGKLK